MTLRRIRARAAFLLAVVVLFGVPAGAVTAARPASDLVKGSVDRTSIALRATYDATADVAWSSGRVTVRTAISLTNTSGGPIDRVELNTVAAALGEIEILRARVDDQDREVTIRGQTLILPLGGVLPKGGSVEIVIRYAARFLSSTTDMDWLWSRSNGIVSAYRWIPWVSLERAFPSGLRVGDPFMTAVSPHVRVTLSSDTPLTFVINAQQVSKEGSSRTYEATNVRDVNFTAAKSYDRLQGTSLDGETPIVVYTRKQPPWPILRWTQRAMQVYEKKLGQYPWPRLVIAESSGGSGMESPGMYWVSTYLDSSKRSYIAVHETAHQWFYGVVSNDQALEPFADEAVSDFLTRWFLDTFRASRCSQKRLDGSIYDYSDACFHEVIYVQGGRFLDDIRADIGNGPFWRALRRYWRANRDDFGSTRELLEALREEARQVGVKLLPRYRDRFPTLY